MSLSEEGVRAGCKMVVGGRVWIARDVHVLVKQSQQTH